MPSHPRERLARAVRIQNENITFVEAPFVDGEQHKFEISIEDLHKAVGEIASSLESIHFLNYFCSSLHEKIEWRIKLEDSNIFANFLSNLLKPNKEYIGVKNTFFSLCEKFEFEFLLLYSLSKDDTFF